MRRPYRSPMEIPSLVKEYLIGKSFCEIGCAEGDLLIEFAKYAKSAMGIEINRDYAEIARSKGLSVIIDDIFAMNKKIPKCDVYYFWLTGGKDKKLIDILPKETTLITYRHMNSDDWNSYDNNDIYFIKPISLQKISNFLPLRYVKGRMFPIMMVIFRIVL